MSDTEMKSEGEEPQVKEEIKEEEGDEMNPEHDDNDIVNTNSEMVLDDILGDDIIGESSGQRGIEWGLIALWDITDSSDLCDSKFYQHKSSLLCNDLSNFC